MRGKVKSILGLLILCLLTGCNKAPVEEKPQETPAPYTGTFGGVRLENAGVEEL